MVYRGTMVHSVGLGNVQVSVKPCHTHERTGEMCEHSAAQQPYLFGEFLADGPPNSSNRRDYFTELVLPV